MDPTLWIAMVVVVALLIGATLLYRRRTGARNSADIDRRHASQAQATEYHKGISGGNYGGGGAGG